ncbi:Pkinase-domain-containing protein [Lizonia empirigonia]|nr:Pkinase-domain-containing protein [Lizonia empirigonia]
MTSRWADDEADKVDQLRRKQEKEEKKRLKLQKQQQAEAAQRPAKRRRLSNGDDATLPDDTTAPRTPEDRTLLRFDAGGWAPCRHRSNYETLNHIEEGSYGWVSRARDISTSQVVALKKVKMDYNQDGFPITALREIAILQKARHPNIVDLKEVLSGDSPEECILVMEFLEHDLKTLQEDMHDPFVASEIKTLLRQLVSGVAFLHENYIMHRDLKTSNILLNNRGQLKLADFGMSRTIPPPSAPLTRLVVTLWYRAPELLLGTPTYSTAIDIWSVGCIFGELIQRTPLLPGTNEVSQLRLTFSLCGLPTSQSWPSFPRLPNAPSLHLPRSQTAPQRFDRARFPALSAAGADLLAALLSLDPARRPAAREVLAHAYFGEQPRPKPEEMFPTFPSRAGLERRGRRSPCKPRRGEGGEVDFSGVFGGRGGGFGLKMV